ncbi:hypothetical protein ACH4VX_10710 [Streptomyces sp. NPDC020731]|uniref:hypothetical protein n=1 Tax=Streptomyces sp. NPDC020731 TaxID=3365085 RepID=UPI003795889E
MTAAFDHEDTRHPVDRLTPSRVRRPCLLVTRDEELSQAAEALPPRPAEEQSAPDGPPALIGAADGPEALAERYDDRIRERVRERFGDRA